MKLATPTVPIDVKTNVTPAAFRAAVYPTLGLSLFFLFGFYGLEGALKALQLFPVQIAAGCAGMILVIELAGVPRRAVLRRFSAGMLFAIILFMVGVLSGSAAAMLIYREFDFVPYVVWPLMLGAIYGVLPAAAFGLIGTGLLRLTSVELESYTTP